MRSDERTLWEQFTTQIRSQILPLVKSKPMVVFNEQSVVFFWVEGKDKRFFVSQPLNNHEDIHIPSLTKIISKRGDVAGIVLVLKATQKTRYSNKQWAASIQQSGISLHIETRTGLSEAWFLPLGRNVPNEPHIINDGASKKGPKRQSLFSFPEHSLVSH